MSDQLSPPAMSSPFPSALEAETETNDPSFHLFPKLPVELRLKIWKLNMPEARILKISTATRTYNSATGGVTYSAKIVKPSCTTPPNLHVNQESRTEALKLYKPIFATRLGHPVFFDFSKDYLWFVGDCIRIRLAHFFDTSNLAEENIKELQLIRNELQNLIVTQMQFQDLSALSSNVNEIAKFRAINMLVLNKFLAESLRADIMAYLRERWAAQHTESFEQFSERTSGQHLHLDFSAGVPVVIVNKAYTVQCPHHSISIHFYTKNAVEAAILGGKFTV
jgi:hypothetical protein